MSDLTALDLVERPLTRVELADALGVSPRTVTRWVAAGCPSERWGRQMRRFMLPEVRGWLREGGGL